MVQNGLGEVAEWRVRKPKAPLPLDRDQFFFSVVSPTKKWLTSGPHIENFFFFRLPNLFSKTLDSCKHGLHYSVELSQYMKYWYINRELDINLCSVPCHEGVKSVYGRSAASSTDFLPSHSFTIACQTFILHLPAHYLEAKEWSPTRMYDN